MAKPRRNYTLDPMLVDAVERYAQRYCNGNQSQAVEHLLKQGIKTEVEETKKGFAYAAVGAAALLVILIA